MAEHEAPEPEKENPPADGGVQAGPGLPVGLQVRFLGPSILALSAAQHKIPSIIPPEKCSGHPLVRGRYFFAFPSALWSRFSEHLGPEGFDRELADLEATLAELCGDYTMNVGFWRGWPIFYDLLRPRKPWRPSVQDLKSLGWETEIGQGKLDHVMRLYEERTKSFAQTARSYVGWLLTNPVFLDEHDSLLREWLEMVKRWGLDRLGLSLPNGLLRMESNPALDPRWSDYTAAFEAFFTRWRLQGLAAPYLPIPLRPLMGGDFPSSVVPQVNRAGGAFCLPDTFPVPGESLREMMEDALRGSEPPEHLKEWQELISARNAARKPLVRYARLFELQHYWRILHHRHATVIYRRLRVLKEVLAAFFGVYSNTIHRDLLFIGKQLGKDWVERSRDYPVGPF